MIRTRSVTTCGPISRPTMGRSRMLLAAALLATLLAATAVGVAAQSEAGAPVSFSGRIHFLGQDCGQGSTRAIIGSVLQMRAFRCDLWMGTSDARFTGTYTTIGNIDTHAAGEFASPNGPFVVSTFVHRVENDQGAWEGVTTTAYVDPTGEGTEFPIPAETLVFRGEGAYDGLTAVVWRQAQSLRGVIFEGTPPPAPSIADTERSE